MAITRLYLFALFLSMTGCSVSDSDIKKFQRNFDKHKADFEALYEAIRAHPSRVGYLVNKHDLPPDISKQMNDLGIINVSVGYSQCENVFNYEFKTSWSRSAAVYFSKNECPKEQVRRGFHSPETNMIEVWGMGDGWVMWVDYDFI